jgi:hypothetical protein
MHPAIQTLLIALGGAIGACLMGAPPILGAFIAFAAHQIAGLLANGGQRTVAGHMRRPSK